MVRNYRTELLTQSTHIPAYMRAGAGVKSDFLPSEKDFEKPGDADGSKGMADWKNTHKLKGSTWV
jgi:hypothetical protein